MKKYDSYKDSGIEWLGEIPLNWSLKRNKDISIINGTSLDNNTNPLYEFKYIDISNVNQNGIINEPELVNFVESPSRARRVINKNDVIVSTVRTYLRAVAFINFDPIDYIVSTGFAVLTPLKTINPTYLAYYCQSDFFIDLVIKNSKGVSYPAINASELACLSNLFPPHPEQTNIAQYLDTKTQAIDIKVNLLDRKIGYYKELRKSIINETVTKGLDKSVKLKDSGIDWIGQIPEHWELKRLKDVVKIYNGYGFPIDAQGDLNGTIPFYKVSDINGSEKYLKTSNNSVSIKTCRENGWKLIPKNSIIVAKIGEALKKNHRKICIKDCLLDNNCMAINTKYNSSFSFWLFVSIDFATFDNMGTIPSLSIKAFNSLLISFPPIKEQSQIATYLDHKTQTIDKIVRNIQTQIATLKELRKTLINDVVTGKIRVIEPVENKVVE